MHVSTPTHKLGNTMDWVMGNKNLWEFQDLHTSDFLSDHCITELVYNISRPNTVKTSSFSRNLKKNNCNKLAKDLDLEIKENIQDGKSLQELYDGFISATETTLDNHAPKSECLEQLRIYYTWCDHKAKTQTATETGREKIVKMREHSWPDSLQAYQ